MVRASRPSLPLRCRHDHRPPLEERQYAVLFMACARAGCTEAAVAEFYQQARVLFPHAPMAGGAHAASIAILLRPGETLAEVMREIRDVGPMRPASA